MIRFEGITVERFLAEVWQREPLLLRGAVDAAAVGVGGDDLAGLACEPEVASRLVLTTGERWRCEAGPFDEARFRALPAQGWTLLVDAVDDWLPEVRALKDHFGFLPRWRLDDVMVSVAAQGGGVGPHFDHYDVFLVQIRGQREWRIGARCDDRTPLRLQHDLRLLEHFQTDDSHLLGPGDVLYLPPGLAHWGIARSEDCITCSVGFRAPSLGELLQGAAALLAEELGESLRYGDDALSLDPDPYRINAAVTARLAQLLQALPAEALAEALTGALGRQVTEVREPPLPAPDPPSMARLLDDLAAGALALRHAPGSRFAYAPHAQGAWLYVDGEAHATSEALARAVCHASLTADALSQPGDARLLQALLEQGVLVIAGDDPS